MESLTTSSVVLADENNVGEFIDKAANYKLAVTGDPINIDRKYKSSIFFTFQGMIIQCMNGFPQMKDKTNSFYRRLLLIPFSKSFEGVERKYIKDDYVLRKEVQEYVLFKALNMDFTELPVPLKCQMELDEFHTENDIVKQFWDDLRDEFVWDLLPTGFVYDLFLSWCERNNPVGKPLGRNAFLQRLSDLLQKDSEWDFDNKNKVPLKTGKRMDKPEVLIFDYQLDNWKNPNYVGRDPAKIINFPKKNLYRGILRRSSVSTLEE